jgi:hypothetical protein
VYGRFVDDGDDLLSTEFSTQLQTTFQTFTRGKTTRKNKRRTAKKQCALSKTWTETDDLLQHKQFRHLKEYPRTPKVRPLFFNRHHRY